MINFDIKKCDYNNAEEYISTEKVLEYANNNKLGFNFTVVNNACNCENKDFELYSFFYALSDDNSEILDDESDMYDMYEKYNNYNLYEIQIYYCPECQRFCIDYHGL